MNVHATHLLEAVEAAVDEYLPHPRTAKEAEALVGVGNVLEQLMEERRRARQVQATQRLANDLAALYEGVRADASAAKACAGRPVPREELFTWRHGCTLEEGILYAVASWARDADETDAAENQALLDQLKLDSDGIVKRGGPVNAAAKILGEVKIASARTIYNRKGRVEPLCEEEYPDKG